MLSMQLQLCYDRGDLVVMGLTWWVISPVREDGEKGVYNGCPLLEQGEDHLQPLWAQQLKQLEGE